MTAGVVNVLENNFVNKLAKKVVLHYGYFSYVNEKLSKS